MHRSVLGYSFLLHFCDTLHPKHGMVCCLTHKILERRCRGDINSDIVVSTFLLYTCLVTTTLQPYRKRISTMKTRPDLSKAADFIWRTARLLDRHRFAFMFLHG